MRVLPACLRPQPTAEPHKAQARAAGLIYGSDTEPGVRRSAKGTGFCYHDASCRRISLQATLQRIRALGVQPAWTEVWSCPEARGHIQATGRDARGRKQYRYHDDWREVRDQDKFERIVDFARLLPGYVCALQRI